MFYLGIEPHGKQFTVNLRDELGEAELRRQVGTRGERAIRTGILTVQGIPVDYFDCLTSVGNALRGVPRHRK